MNDTDLNNPSKEENQDEGKNSNNDDLNHENISKEDTIFDKEKDDEDAIDDEEILIDVPNTEVSEYNIIYFKKKYYF